MNLRLQNILPFVFAFFANEVSAKIFIEPHGAFIVTGSSSSQGDSTYSGPAYGAKVGYYEKEFGFNFGLDFTHSTYTYSSADFSSPIIVRNDLGAFVGYNSQNQYRVWGGIYYTKSGHGTSDDYTSGHTYEIGLGYSVSQKVSLNIYYRLPSYTKYSISGSVRS